MSRRYLFGPISAHFATDNLSEPRATGQCLAFNAEGTLDLRINPTDRWETIIARLPAGWQPDFLVLYLPYASIPMGLWSAPVPLVGLAADWNLLFHGYRHWLRRCELVLTDTLGVEALARAGIEHACAANLFGCPRSFLEEMVPESEAAVDVLFVGNVHNAVQSARLPWLARLARLGDRWQVAIRTGIHGKDYRALLAGARIVFNQSIRGECNLRVFEAAASGALLFQEADNREVRAYFQGDQECVYYTEENLDSLLHYYLEHEDKRRTIAEAARARVHRFTFEGLWKSHLALIDREWHGIKARQGQRPTFDAESTLLARCWQAVSCAQCAGDPALTNDLGAALATAPRSASLHNALGVAVTVAGSAAGAATVNHAEQAAGYFRRALAHDPNHILAGLNLVEALVGLDQKPEAIDQAWRTLYVLDRTDAEHLPGLDDCHFPPAFDHFRVEWERAAWANPGHRAAEVNAKRDLLRWRLHALLAELTGELAHHYEAVGARPDLAPTRAALGCALGRAGRPGPAVPHLRQAVRAVPFDSAAARALFHALGESGDVRGQRVLARDRRLLARAAPQLVRAESWFAECPPVGDELASILILCCNEIAFTRQCLESVLCHTRRPFELVLVDNGSTDGTLDLLHELAQKPGPARAEIIHNESNRGFAAGCNLAIAAAHGDYLVFLNNDTIVTAGWLDGLIGQALADWPKTGLVGAVSNYAPPPQRVPGAYATLDGLPDFAARRRRDFAGKALAVERLTGFCLLGRREVLQHVGVFDERFGTGFFEDDDLCVRVRKEGYQLRLALEVYIHHFGSRTFAGLGIDGPRQLRANFARFQDKWGTEITAGYRLPPEVARDEQPDASEPQRPPIAGDPRLAAIPAAVPSTPDLLPLSPHTRVSLCMIVKNEEANLPASLHSAADLVDEVLVVDTGSTDRTKEVAARFGAKVVDFPWVDSFAAARNASIEHALGDWIFWLDADDRVDQDNRTRLRDLFANLGTDNAAYVMKCHCLPDPATGVATVVDHLRLFPNRPEVRWRYRVHEQILPALRAVGADVRWADVVIHHTGYQDSVFRRKKLERDLRLLNLENAEHPDDPFTLFNLGSVHQEIGQAAQALPLLRRSLVRSHPRDSIVRKLFALIVQCHRQLNQPAEALEACQAGRVHYPEDAELLFLEARVRTQQGDKSGAEGCLLHLIEGREGAHFASLAEGLRGYKARHELAILYRDQGRLAEAEAQWEIILREQPAFVPAVVGLGELYLAQGRWPALDGLVERLRGLPEGEVEGATLQARAHLVRREFVQARLLLRETIAQSPQALWPRVILSRVLLEEGREWDGAEQALRDVLEMAPNHAEASRNLDVLLQRKGARIGQTATVEI
jgi:GT2 family glycosyltransferase/tetratricopeptide (TPR) repeat protein